jgi:late competence protein required for DNA uptake (superfamily II DNA/RNA helicase)
MKWLIILLLILIPIALIAFRYRQQLLMAWQMWQMFRKVKQAAQPPAKKQVKERSTDKSEQLIRCERCGTWVSQKEALKLRSKTAYCSANCMERAAKLQSLVD